MKNLKFVFVSIALASFALMYSCGNSGNNEVSKDSIVEEIKADTLKTSQLNEKTAKFVCPMKCEGSFAEVKGKCPKCGMDEIENPNFGK